MTQVTDKVNTSGSKNTRSNVVVDWFIRLIKGIIVGIGFILPGLSGGVLAVILGMTELSNFVRFAKGFRSECFFLFR